MRILPIATISKASFTATTAISLASFGISAGSAPAARAGEICVSCEGPAAAYRCEVEGTAAAGDSDGGLQFLCIKDIAQRRGHASCAVARQGAAGCNGEPWRITREAAGTGTESGGVVIPRLRTPPVDGNAPAAAASKAAEPVATAPDAARHKDAPRGPTPAATAGTPTTAGQATHITPPRAGEAARVATPAGTAAEPPRAHEAPPARASSPGALENAGDAIGGAAKKSWDCVTSLFKRC